MIPIPKEIAGMTDYDENDNWILKPGATEKQKKIFDQFKRDLESGKLSDVKIECEE
jgi:hypothetical protein